jgi:hypothetical protein
MNKPFFNAKAQRRKGAKEQRRKEFKRFFASFASLRLRVKRDSAYLHSFSSKN